ncbi:hypothetical protein [Clostridium lacusfryxellense]|uniref:hypothetical protein n=1 Tax=Clostridium lacusfryxellense TaxID=205328 RepID=UPI001C0E782D|nr:hypothetical protein [Clostridium lacusfryxellense]MBU3111977.1 hypothetical protein [Clostridium lacusfryxellense]
MNLENGIKDIISKKLEDGTVEKLIGDELEKGIIRALDRILGSYGDVTKVIEEKVKAVMIPYLEGYDYSKYIVKLDSILVDVLKSSALENKKLLTNFKELMISDEKKKSIKSSELFEAWKKYVCKNVATSELEVEYDDGPSYECVEVTLTIDEDEGRNWSSFEYATLVLECEKDEDMNFAIRLSKYNKDKGAKWDISYDTAHDIKSLRYLNEFEIFLMKLAQNGTTLEADITDDSDDITPDAEPEASFS